MRASAALAAGLTIACGVAAGPHGASAAPAPKTARLSGYVEICGGPAPGACRIETAGFCAPRCENTHSVAVLDSRGRQVAATDLRGARYSLAVPAGRLTVELLSGRGHVMQRKHVSTRRGRTTTLAFVFIVP